MRGPMLDNNKFWMHFKKKDFFPIKKIKYNKNTIKIPGNPNKILKRIYGNRWNIQLKKGQDYFHYFMFNKPILFENKLLIAFLQFQQHKSITKVGHSLIHYALSSRLFKFINR